ncbi:hypothetical protein HBE96_08580 [Clostridium sp. P21]|uniref:Uncharacterized protein n=1 Tax=Clostridium muellerianum TaxID=2716538 RepID=A0A7Y0EFZ3_9CLOT|nr:DUF6033 family protein [Clostridium muellerianum]NMM62750.1 hypothetical protein [Clostridium muellerianum]
MSIEIGSSYNRYYTQISNNSMNNSNKIVDNNTINNSAKTVSKDEYFNNLCNKYPGVNINMSDSYLFNKNGTTTFNVSPKYVEKAMKDPKAAENLNRLLNLAPSFPQYLSTHKYMPDGKEITDVSFVIDENGGVSCNCKYKEKKSKDTDELSDVEKIRRKKLKELREEKSKITKQQKAYYNNSSRIFDIADINLISTRM